MCVVLKKKNVENVLIFIYFQMSDVLDILDIERPQTPEISKESILGENKKVSFKY